MVANPFQTLLIDADILAFKVAAKAQQKHTFPGCEPSLVVDDWADVVPRIVEQVDTWVEKAGGGSPLICLSCPSAEGWRVNRVLPSYKADRDPESRPVYLGDVKKYLEDNYPSYRRPTLEADDIMGILSTHPSLVPGKKVIVSSDKDMKTIPGWLFNQDKDRSPRRIASVEADYWHLYQTLVGDTTDGYKGCPGMGPKKAERLLDGWMDYSDISVWLSIVQAFEARGLTEEDALIQARVARICRASDYDFNKKEVILWTPQ